MCKKKFSGVLLLLLLLIPCFLSASAGTAEAYEIIAAVRQGDYVYQRSVGALSGYILNNLEREFCLAVTGTFGESFNENFSLSITVEPLGSLSLSNVLINGYSGSATRGLYTCYPKRSFPAVYSALSFPTFTISINGNEGDQYRFTVTARDRDHNTTLPTKSFTLTVHNNNVSEHPVITEPQANDSLTLYFPGTTYSNLKGERVANWRIGTENIISAARNLIADFNISRPNSDSTSFSFHTFYNSEIDGYDKKSIGYLTVYAANRYGYEVSRDIEIKVELAKKYKDPVIDNPTQDLSVLYGSNAEAVFTGQYISSWTCDKSNLPGFIQDVILDYRENSNKCKVNVFLSPDATIGSTYALQLTASNGMNTKSTAATLNIKAIGNKEDYEDPVIDSDETISVVQGKSASAVFTGKYVKRWGYRSNLPDDIDGIKFNYASNPNKCEVVVTAKSDAAVTSSPLSIDIYAYNTIGEESSTPKKLYINILENDETAAPVINETAQEISIVPGGTATVIFTGKHTRTWRWEKADSSSTTDIVKNIELNYLSNPARCEVRVTLNEGLAAGVTDTINIYASNAVGTEIATPAKLTIKVASTGDNEPPAIDKSETVSVVKGGTAKATFTGQHIRSWAYGTLPEAIHAVELRPAANPNRCDVLVTAADNPAATSATVTIYAYNAIGEVVSAELNVTILSDGGSKTDPKIDGSKTKTISVLKGGTAKAVFTGTNIRAWAYGNLPDGVKSIQLNYAANPNRCDVLVTAASNTTATSGTVTIYAFNEIGEMDSATLTVNFIEDGAKYDEPVIDAVKTVSVVQGGTVHVSLTGKNIVLWTYDNLPDGIKSLEFIYNNNPNKCTAAITAGSKAATGSKTITIYAFNEIGEYVSQTLTVNVTASGSGYDDPTIDSDDLKDAVKVVPGGKISVSFDATNVSGFAYSVIPNEINYVDWEVKDDGKKGAFFIAVSSTAEVKSTLSFDVYGFNEIGEVSETATIKLTVVEDTGNNTPVNKNTEEIDDTDVGGIIIDTFTCAGAKNWDINLFELPEIVNAIDMSYDIDSPEICEVIVILSDNDSLYTSGYANIAANTTHSFKVYAYNEIGSATSGDFTFTVSNSDSDSGGSSKGSSSGCNSGISGLTDLGVAGLLILIYYLTSRKLKN